MTMATDSVSGSRHDPAYEKSMAALHSGDWPNAIRGLRELLRRFPDDPVLAQALDEAEFRAEVDAQSHIRAKRWAVNWRPHLTRLAAVGLVLLLVTLSAYVVRGRIAPLLSERQNAQQIAALLEAGEAYIEAGELAGARRAFENLLALAPEHSGALEGLARVEAEERLLELYRNAVREEEQAAAHVAQTVTAEGLYDSAHAADARAGYEAALAAYSDLLVMAPHYRDAGTRVLEIRRVLQMEELLNQAITLELLGLEADAIQRYNQVQQIDLVYKRAYISSRLVGLNLKLGERILAQNPPALQLMPDALAYFDAVLAQDPTHPAATRQRRLARLYLTGRQAYDGRRWQEAADTLRVLYEAQPDYLSGALTPLLYDALVGSGDDASAAGDIYRAYDQYTRACALPVPDRTVCQGRIAAVVPLMTPTPTPTLTSTPAPTSPPPVPATATATPTPRPLQQFRGRIVFKADHPEQPGFWVMDADGANREYLGPFELYAAQFDALREQERSSPDGRYRVYTAALDGRAQVFLEFPLGEGAGNKPLTRLTGIAYDPVWAPDGTAILFVTQENESDDIWFITPDGQRQEALMRNDWEWDKHPSWSPDSLRIVFWSNREGANQLFVMERTGRGPHNISRVAWNEYDPVWVK